MSKYIIIEEKIYNQMHKDYGYCSHCGKKECSGKNSSSRLPKNIVDILDKILSILHKEIDNE